MLFWTFDFERKKDSQIFLWAIGVPKKLKIFKKHWKNTIQESCTKKDTILHQAPQITLFFDSPRIYIYIYQVWTEWLWKYGNINYICHFMIAHPWRKIATFFRNVLFNCAQINILFTQVHKFWLDLASS